MNFGPQVDENTALQMTNIFLSNVNIELDSAYVYNDGVTERIIGSILPKLSSNNYSIATKVHPRITGNLDSKSVYKQFYESLDRMKLEKLDILYFHFPDSVKPIEDALNAINSLFLEGKITEFGLSNFPAWMVVDIWHICKNKGWVVPTVYQGRYNGLSRNVEAELIPALRKLNMRFYAYNPLAGGLLTGKHINFEEIPTEGRFARLKTYRDRYWKKSYFDAVNVFTSKCNEFNILPSEAAFRWLTHHSMLDSTKGDGIIIGASSVQQLEQNMSSIQGGKLPDIIVEAINRAWDEAKADSPAYFNFF